MQRYKNHDIGHLGYNISFECRMLVLVGDSAIYNSYISMMTPMYLFIFFESIYKELLTLVTNFILKILCVQYKMALLKVYFFLLTLCGTKLCFD